MSIDIHDVIIIGGGPAGLTAGIYTSRLGLRTLLLEEGELGGRAVNAHSIDNFPGFHEGITGSELMSRFIKQAKRFGIEFREEAVLSLEVIGEIKMVTTRRGVYQAKTIIVATGIQRKGMKIPGEGDFKGLGVSYCTICDGPLYSGKTVAVLGNGEEAAEETMRMADIASKVYAIPGSKGYKDEIEGVKDLYEHKKIVIIEGTDVESISGDNLVTHLNLKGSPNPIEIEGVFVILENIPTTEIIREAGIETNESGCILVDKNQQTNIEGVFAAGDCVCGGMQVITAAGEGGHAGLSAHRYIKSMR